MLVRVRVQLLMWVRVCTVGARMWARRCVWMCVFRSVNKLCRPIPNHPKCGAPAVISRIFGAFLVFRMLYNPSTCA